MARTRLLKPGFFANETLAEVHPFGRLLFAGLWTIADRKGRLPDKPKWIKGQLFPFENVPVEKLLSELEGLGFIARYEAEGQRCILIVKFHKHQNPHKNEGPSLLPAPFPEYLADAMDGAPRSIGTSEDDQLREGSLQWMNDSGGIRNTVKDTVSDPVAEPRARSKDLSPAVEFHPTTEPPWPDEEGLVGEWRRQYELSGAGLFSWGFEAEQLAKEFGEDAVRSAASHTGWVKHPNYLRPKLEQQRATATSEAAPPTPSLRYRS